MSSSKRRRLDPPKQSKMFNYFSKEGAPTLGTRQSKDTTDNPFLKRSGPKVIPRVIPRVIPSLVQDSPPQNSSCQEKSPIRVNSSFLSSDEMLIRIKKDTTRNEAGHTKAIGEEHLLSDIEEIETLRDIATQPFSQLIVCRRTKDNEPDSIQSLSDIPTQPHSQIVVLDKRHRSRDIDTLGEVHSLSDIATQPHSPEVVLKKADRFTHPAEKWCKTSRLEKKSGVVHPAESVEELNSWDSLEPSLPVLLNHKVKAVSDVSSSNVNKAENLVDSEVSAAVWAMFGISDDEEEPQAEREKCDPVNRLPDPVNRSLDPANSSPDPANRSPDPVNGSPDPANRSPDPVNRSPDPANRSLDPVNGSSDPASESLSPTEFLDSQDYYYNNVMRGPNSVFN